MNRLTDSATSSAQNQGSALLNRSRAQLRLPADAISDTLRLAQVQAIANVDPVRAPDPPNQEVIDRLEGAGIVADGLLDPVAFELLEVVNQASLVIAVDLSYLDDTSVPTVWSTPRQAVVSCSLDPAHIELRPVPVTQLPQVLAELIVLRTPRFIGDMPISINNQVLARAQKTDDRAAALELLVEGGGDPDQAVLLLDLLRRDVRRWKISSTWSTGEGQQSAELQGLDAGPSGQWLLSSNKDGDNKIFTPLGHGEIMSAFRQVLPRNWMGTPLNRPTPIA